MPRDNSGELRVEWKISLPATLAARVEMLMLDPATSKPKYGVRSALVTQLLEAWCASQDFDPSVLNEEVLDA